MRLLHLGCSIICDRWQCCMSCHMHLQQRQCIAAQQFAPSDLVMKLQARTAWGQPHQQSLHILSTVCTGSVGQFGATARCSAIIMHRITFCDQLSLYTLCTTQPCMLSRQGAHVLGEARNTDSGGSYAVPLSNVHVDKCILRANTNTIFTTNCVIVDPNCSAAV